MKNDNSEFIQTVKDSTDILEVIGRSVRLKRSGKSYKGLCPFHQDTEPSFNVDPVKQRFYCFGCEASGDVIEFLQRNQGTPFWETVCELATEKGIEIPNLSPEAKKHIEEESLLGEIRMATAKYYQRCLTEKIKRHYMEKRDFGESIISKFMIGYASGGLKKELLERCGFPEEACIKAGVLKRHEDGSVKDFFYNRLTFPVINREKVDSFSARRLGESGPKWLHLPGEIKSLYNGDDVYNEEVYLAEGIPDCQTAVKAFFPSVAILGKNFNPAFAPKFNKCEIVFVGIHLHEQGGPEKAMAIAELLGDKARIVEIPDELDLNDYMQGKSPEDFQRLLANAKDPMSYQLSLIPLEINKVELSKHLDPILKQLANMDAPLASAYLDQIYDTFKDPLRVNKEDIKAYRQQIKKFQGEVDKDNLDDLEGGEVVWKDYPIMNPAQDFIGGKAFFTAYLPVEIEGLILRMAYIITSDGEKYPLEEKFLQEHGLRRKHIDQIPSDVGRWSIEEDIPNSIYNFLEGNTNVDPAEIFTKINQLFRTYLDFPDDRYFAYLTLWCMGTYLFIMFESFPYTMLNATKRAGKTRTIELSAPVCYNSSMGASISDAAIYRSIENDRCTIFHDEAEKFNRENKNDRSDRLEIYNSGYKKSGSVARCEGENHKPRQYSTYSPKMLANIEGLDATSADRTITLNLLRSKRRMPKFVSRKHEKLFQEIRNSLYGLVMEFHEEINLIYETMPEIEGLQDREEELWGPILVLAKFIDRYRQKQDPDSEDDLIFNEMLGFALDCGAKKRQEEEEDNAEQRILITVIDFICDPEVHPRSGGNDDFYSSDDLLEYVHRQEGLHWVTKHWLGKTLTKLHIIKDKKEDKSYSNRSTRDEAGDTKNKSVLFYRLDRERIIDVGKRFGLEEKVAGISVEKNSQQESQQESQQAQLFEDQDYLPF